MAPSLSVQQLTEVRERVPHAVGGVLDPGGVGEVADRGEDPVALDGPVGTGRRRPADGGRRVGDVQHRQVPRRPGHCDRREARSTAAAGRR